MSKQLFFRQPGSSPPARSRLFRGAGWGLLLLLLASPLGGCTWLAMAQQRTVGTPMPPRYAGLDNHSVAIVVYANDSTTYDYPQARQEVSSFVANAIEKHLLKVRLLNYKDVIRYQNDTLNWQELPVKAIGKHFGVARVLYIELLRYSSREAGATDLLRGTIKANCAVYNCRRPGQSPVWSNVLEVRWPESGPEDVLQSSDTIVRLHALELFSRRLARKFYTWRFHGPRMHR